MAEISIIIRAKSMLAQAFSGAMGEVSAFGAKMKGAFSGIGGSIAGLVGFGGMTALVKSAIEYAGNIKEAGQRTGFTISNVQKLNFAATQTGASFDAVELAVKSMSTTLNGALTPDKERWFKRLGLSVNELRLMKPDDMFEAVGRAIAALPDPTTRAAAAFEMFGKSGIKLLPMLSDLENLKNQFTGLDDAQIKTLGSLNDLIAKYQLLAKVKVGEVLTTDKGYAVAGGALTGAVVGGVLGKSTGAAAAGATAGGTIAGGLFDGWVKSWMAIMKKPATPMTYGEMTNESLSQARTDKAAADKEVARKKAAQAELDLAAAAEKTAADEKEYAKMRIAAHKKSDDAIKEKLDLDEMAKKKDAENLKKNTEQFEKEQAAKRGLEQAILFATDEISRQTALEKYNKAEKKSGGLLFKPGTLPIDPETGMPEVGGIGEMKTTKGINDAKRAAALAEKVKLRNEEKFQKLYTNAIEKQDHGRWLSTKEKSAIAQGWNMMGQAQNQPGLQIDDVPAQQLDQLQQINSKIDGIVLLNAKG